MIDTYLCARDEAVLLALYKKYTNVIGPVSGRAEIPAHVDVDGTEIPTASSIGDPQMFYTCIRSDEAIPVSDGITVCDEDTGRALCGVWA